jgi:hypothetical protein
MGSAPLAGGVSRFGGWWGARAGTELGAQRWRSDGASRSPYQIPPRSQNCCYKEWPRAVWCDNGAGTALVSGVQNHPFFVAPR